MRLRTLSKIWNSQRTLPEHDRAAKLIGNPFCRQSDERQCSVAQLKFEKLCRSETRVGRVRIGLLRLFLRRYAVGEFGYPLHPQARCSFGRTRWYCVRPRRAKTPARNTSVYGLGERTWSEARSQEHRFPLPTRLRCFFRRGHNGRLAPDCLPWVSLISSDVCLPRRRQVSLVGGGPLQRHQCRRRQETHQPRLSR